MFNRLLYFFVLLLVCCCQHALPQPFPQLHFQYLSEKDGLSNNMVTTIAQDKNGFLWFGTVNGLNRYDGYRFKTFYHAERDSITLPNNNISAITNAAENNLWISTKGGLAFFDLHTYRCKNIQHNDNDPGSIKKDDDIQPFFDDGGGILLSTYEGLYKLNTNFSVNEIQQEVQPFNFYQEYRKYCQGIFKDRKGRLWSRIANRIYQLNTVSKKAEHTFIMPGEFHITSMYFDDDNTCWLTTWGNGVVKFNTTTFLFEKIDLGAVSLITGNITSWTVNGKKYLVICSLGKGFFLVDPVTLQYKNYLADEYDKPLLAHTHVSSAFVDRQNNLWLATNNGINYVTASSSLFDVIPLYLDKADALQPADEGRVVKNFFEDEKGFWTGKWHSGGSFFYDTSWRLQKFLKALYGPPVNLNKTTQVYNTLRWKGNLYFTTDSGLVKLNPVNYKTSLLAPEFSHFPVDLRNIIQLNDSLWWIRSHGYGIYAFNPVTEKFIRQYGGKDTCSNCLPLAHFEYLLKDKTGTVWLTTESGLYKYIPASDNFTVFRRNENAPRTFPSNKFSGMAEDADGKLWIGTDAGMCMFDPVTGKVEKIFAENTYISIVFRVCVDDFQNVWFNSRTGIWCWIRKLDKLVKYGVAEGIPQGFELGVMEKTANGNIYAGCTDAVVRFKPGKLMHYMQAAPGAQITDITVDNRPATIRHGIEKALVLQPGEKTFSIDFTVLNYDQPANNQYFYRLLSHSAVWVENNTGHLNFYNLSPGTHRLEVRGKNKLSNSFGEPDHILIIVKPYWYQTFFFKLLVFSLIAVGGLLFYKWRIKSVKKEASVKQKIAETEMQALRAQMNPHFIFNSLNSIENFIMKSEKRLASDYLNKFARLIRMILDSSRNEVVPFAKDIEALQLYVDLEQLRFNNKFSYKTVIDPVLLNGDYRVPSLIIQPYVENAIVHGLAHSEKENLALTVTASLENDVIKYTVQDNGIGRNKAAGYNMQNKPQHKSIGLKITEDRINIFNNNTEGRSAVKFTDLYNSNNESLGTIVEIKINAK